MHGVERRLMRGLLPLLLTLGKKGSETATMTSERKTASSSDRGFLDGLRHAFGRGSRKVSEEELKSLVDDNDELLEDEKRMIGEILDLDELTVSDIMQPRVDIIAVEDDETIRQAIERMQGTGYSRLPVYKDDLDHIVGIVYIKDLIPAVLDGSIDSPVAPFARKPMYVPETKDLFPLLSEMQTKRQQIAIVVDEYGGTDGLITIEDIVEEIVGEIIDETDSENAFLTQLTDREWIVDGRLPIEDALALGWPVSDDGQYDTIAGWLLDETDAIPKVGDELTLGGYRFKVQNMRRRRIQTLRVIREDADSAEPAGN